MADTEISADTDTEISADTETDNFQSLVSTSFCAIKDGWHRKKLSYQKNKQKMIQCVLHQCLFPDLDAIEYLNVCVRSIKLNLSFIF